MRGHHRPTGSAHLQSMVRHLQPRAGCRAPTWREEQPETPSPQHHVEPSLSLHGSEAGPGSPSKGLFSPPFPGLAGSGQTPPLLLTVPPSNSPPRGLPHHRPAHCQPPPFPWTGFSRPPPLFSAVNTDHLHCMRTCTRSAFRVPFRHFRGQPGEAPPEVPVAATRITQTSRLQPTQAVLFLDVRRLAQASPATAEAPPEHVFLEVPGEDPGSLPSAWGLAGGVRHGTRWALGRRSFPCSGRAKAPCSAGCELQAELSFQRRPRSLAHGPSLHLQSQKQRPSLCREPLSGFLQPEKLHVIRLSPPGQPPHLQVLLPWAGASTRAGD